MMNRVVVRVGVLMMFLAVTPQASSQRTTVLNRVAAYLTAHAQEYIALRRDLHRHPELSGSEVRTARIIVDRLKAIGLEVRTEVGGHGVVALLKGGQPGPLVAYRAEMDAAPSKDPDPVDFASETPGVRHVCGHDVHMAIGVALASALASVREELPGSVLFVFQPAEEVATGAKAMLADGVFAARKPVAIYGVHTAPYEVEQLATRPGVMMAPRDRLTVTVTGTGDLQRALDSARSVVNAQATIKAEEAFRPAPEDFRLVQAQPPARIGSGDLQFHATITLASAAAREQVKQAIARGLAEIAVPGATLTHRHVDKAIAGVTNDVQLTADAVRSLASALGESALAAPPGIIPAFSEDFGFFQDEVPGVFFFLGVSNAAKKVVGMPHSPNYVADEDAIAFGARGMAAVLLDRLSRR
jgi:metal-dependent amidase/aminoacylase/carboxypeptidase family protein